MKYVITNADDYGYSQDVSEAIIESNLQGVLTSTTVLVNFVTEKQVQIAKQTPSLNFGLHLNITSGEPLTKNWKEKYGSFVRPNRNQPNQFDRELWIEFFKKFDTEDIYKEYLAQYERFIELFEVSPTHLDSHHYSSGFEQSFEAFSRIAREKDLPVRPQGLFDFSINQHPMGNIDHMPALNAKLKQMGVKSPNYFSLLYLNRYENYLEVAENELTKIQDGEIIELAFHPGYNEDWRIKDLEILKDPKFRELLEKQNCKLISYKDIN